LTSARCDDLVELVVVAGVLEVHGDDGSQRRGVGHLDQDAARRDVAGRPRNESPYSSLPNHDQERLIEARIDALLDDRDGDRGRVIFEDMGQVQRFATLHHLMIGGPAHGVQ